MNKKLKKKKILKLFGINILLYSLLFGLVTLNKQVFRPAFNHSQLGSILTGSFPNFIAAYLINLCIVNGVWIRKPKFGRPIVYGLALIITAVLVHEEFKSIWGKFQRHLSHTKGIKITLNMQADHPEISSAAQIIAEIFGIIYILNKGIACNPDFWI